MYRARKLFSFASDVVILGTHSFSNAFSKSLGIRNALTRDSTSHMKAFDRAAKESLTRPESLLVSVSPCFVWYTYAVDVNGHYSRGISLLSSLGLRDYLFCLYEGIGNLCFQNKIEEGQQGEQDPFST